MNVTVNGAPRELPPGTTVAELLKALNIGPRGVAVEVNLNIVPAVRHAQESLADGDQVEVVTLVGGG